jgi:hypothetical protein
MKKNEPNTKSSTSDKVADETTKIEVKETSACEQEPESFEERELKLLQEYSEQIRLGLSNDDNKLDIDTVIANLKIIKTKLDLLLDDISHKEEQNVGEDNLIKKKHNSKKNKIKSKR